MKKHDLITKLFKVDNLINSVASYQLHYQISLGVYIKESSFDESKVEDLGLDIDPENVFNTIIQIVTSFSKENDFDSIFNDNMRINAMLHSLKDFTLKNEDLDKEENIYDTFYKRVMDDEFYTMNMHIYFEEELKSRVEYWKNLINKKTARELKESALKMV
jgi:hypothetical protein